jgi:hypothetical protein
MDLVAGGIKLVIRRLRPSDVIAIALDIERQEQQNVRKLKGLNQASWQELVNLVDRNGHQTLEEDICRILQLQQDRQQAEALAARSNMVTIVRMLHDKTSQLMDMLVRALAAGKLCVVDVSQMRGQQALVLSGLILRHIFDRNQQQFTAARPETIPTIAVIEEAQTVLNERASSSEPYLAWVKEGRKYDLGVVLVTQQPGSIPQEILSQGDNWFLFHLLSAGDLLRVKQANAHFSDDLLSSLLNEPIPGQGVFWSSAGGRPYPTPIRALSFEALHRPYDPDFTKVGERTYASTLRDQFAATLRQAAEAGRAASEMVSGIRTRGNGHQPGQLQLLDDEEDNTGSEDGNEDPLLIDPLEAFKQNAVLALRQDADLCRRLRQEGAAWGELKAFLKGRLPETLEDRDEVAYQLVAPALEAIYGKRGEGWRTFKHEQKGTTWAKAVTASDRVHGG